MTLRALNTGDLTIRQQVIDHMRDQVALISGVANVRYRLPGSDQIRKPVRRDECPLAYVYDGPDDERLSQEYDSKLVNELPVGVAIVDDFDPEADDDSPQNMMRKGNRYIGVLEQAMSDGELAWPATGIQVDGVTPLSAFIAELTSDDGPLMIAGVHVQVAYWVDSDDPFSS